MFGFKALGVSDKVLSVVIQDVAVIVAAAVHIAIVHKSVGVCNPGKLSTTTYINLNTAVTRRYPTFAVLATISLYVVCVFEPSLIGVRVPPIPCSTSTELYPVAASHVLRCH